LKKKKKIQIPSVIYLINLDAVDTDRHQCGDGTKALFTPGIKMHFGLSEHKWPINTSVNRV